MSSIHMNGSHINEINKINFNLANEDFKANQKIKTKYTVLSIAIVAGMLVTVFSIGAGLIVSGNSQMVLAGKILMHSAKIFVPAAGLGVYCIGHYKSLLMYKIAPYKDEGYARKILDSLLIEDLSYITSNYDIDFLRRYNYITEKGETVLKDYVPGLNNLDEYENEKAS